MKRLVALALMFGPIGLGALTAVTPASPDPLAPVAWMAGGVWRGEVKGRTARQPELRRELTRS